MTSQNSLGILLLLVAGVPAHATAIDSVSVSFQGTATLTLCQGEIDYCSKWLGKTIAFGSGWNFDARYSTFFPDASGGLNADEPRYVPGGWDMARLGDTTFIKQGGEFCPYADCTTLNLSFLPLWHNLDLTALTSGTLSIYIPGTNYRHVLYSVTGVITVDTVTHWTGSTQDAFESTAVTLAPEPSSLALLAAGLLVLIKVARHRE